MQLIDALNAHREISDILIAYCRHLDRMNLSALAALFTSDCMVRFGDDPALVANGREALEHSMARMWRWKRTSHQLSNIRISFGSQREAKAESYVHAWHEYQDGHSATIYGSYFDSLIKGPDGWKIEQRRMEMNGADAGFKVAIPPAPRMAPPAGWRAPTHLDQTSS